MSNALTALFPPTVGTALARLADERRDCPYPAERDALARASGRRQREFLAGRACAHAALRAIGRDGRPVGRGATGEPLWPAGVAGSISHAGELAVAAAAPLAEAWGVGLDVELLDPPLDAAVERLVLRPDELGRAAAAGDLGPERGKIGFAAKECVCKCLFPRTRWLLEFGDVAVEIDSERCRFRAAVGDRFRLAGAPLAPLDGRFALAGGYVLTGLWIGPEGPLGARRRVARASERRVRALAAHGISRSGPRKR